MSQKQDDRVVQLTAEGLEELKAELTDLEENKLPAAIKRVAIARSHGDLKENAEYHNAKEDQSFVENRISEIQDVISRSKVVKNTKSHSKVGMGSTVVVELQGKTKKIKTFHIVGEYESNPMEGKVSTKSPIGAALMDSKVGDKVKVTTPAGEVIYLIKEIK